MINPKFSIEQEADFITLKIYTPYIKAQNAEFLIDGAQIRFLLNPYFLRLTLPGQVIEDERSQAKYDLATGYFTVQLYKVNPGEHFKDLDMLSKLLATQKELDTGVERTQIKKPLIEELDFDDLRNQLEEETEEDPFDWELPQQIVDEEKPLLNQVYYGFNNQYSGYFQHVQMTPNEINEIDNPETTAPLDRTKERILKENEKFDEDYYMSDFMFQDQEEFQQILNYRPIWHDVLSRLTSNNPSKPSTSLVQEANSNPSNSLIQEVAPTPPAVSNSLIQEVDAPAPSASLIEEVNPNLHTGKLLITVVDSQDTSSLEQSLDKLSIAKSNPPESDLNELQFNDKEKEIMRKLPKKSYLINDPKSLYLGLVDLMYCYSYNLRTNFGENTVESTWIIGKLSPTLSSLETFQSLKHCVVSLFRRSLCYPLYRNFKLCEVLIDDVYKIFKLGQRAILKILLELKDLFDHNDLYYRYSKLFFDDYCNWVQIHAKPHILKSLAHQLRHNTQINKSDIDWDLEEWESLAQEAQEEGFVEDMDIDEEDEQFN